MNLIWLTAIGVGLTLYQYKIISNLPLIVLLVVSLGFLLSRLSNVEGFESSDNNRVVRYGDIVTIWTWKNTYMKGADGVMMSSALASPSSLPRGWESEYWIIEDPKDPQGPGNSNPVRFGEQIYLRSKRTHKYLRPRNNNLVDLGPRGSWERITIESSDISSNSTGLIGYGDMFYFKTWRETYIRLNDDGKFDQKKARDAKCIFRIYDQHGQGADVDWSRQGTASQSSKYGQFPAINCIDGNMMSFNHTQNEPYSWWQVKLPQDIYVTKIHIFNRRDCCQNRLSNFDIKILDEDGKEIVSHYQKGSSAETIWNGVNRIGRIVKVQLRGRNSLHMSDFKVFGKRVDYSLLLDNPVSTDLLLSPARFGGGKSKTVFNESLPQSDRNRSASVMFFIKPSSIKGVTTILSKGHGDRQRAPMIQLNENSQLIVSQSTMKSVDETLTSTSKLPRGEWSHVAVVVSNGVSPESGWLYGQFSEPITVGPRSACCYVIHPLLKQMYHAPDPGAFVESPKQTWDASVALSMRYVGVLSEQAQQKTLSLYLNGRQDNQLKLGGKPLFNKAQLKIGDGTSTFYLDKLQYANYVVPESKIVRDSVYQIKNATVELLSGIKNAKDRVQVEPHNLPAVHKNQMTVAFWIKTDRPAEGTKRWTQIFRKGGADPTDRAPAMWYMPTSNTVHAPIKVAGGKKWGEGIVKSKHTASTGIWYHYTLIIDGKKETFYVNGKMVDQKSLPGAVSWKISPLVIGGFQGELKDFKYSNYAWSHAEIKSLMGNHPNIVYHQKIQKMWSDQGCISDPSQGDWASIASWSSFLKAGQDDQLRSLMKRLKYKADKGDPKAQLQCYGAGGSKLYQRLRQKERLLKFALDEQKNGKKCLPIAPFTCDRKTVNDFDIRTHSNFHKYVLANRVQPVKGTGSVQQSADLKKYRLQLAENQQMIEDLKKLKLNAETKVSDLENKMKQMQQQSVQPVELVKAHPKYHQLRQKLATKNQELETIRLEKERLESVQQQPPTKQLSQMQAELVQAKQLAAANLSQNLDVRKLQKNAMFREILDQIVKRDVKSDPRFQRIKRLSEERRDKYLKQRKQIRETSQQLESTKRLAEELLQTMGQSDPKTIHELISSKEKLSNDPKYKKLLKGIRKTSKADDIHQHPEYQKLLKQVNALNRETANGTSPAELVRLKAQAKKCKMILRDHPTQVAQVEQLLLERLKRDPEFARKTSLKMLQQAQSDPEIKRLLGGTMWKTREGKALVEQVARDKAASDPQFRVMAAQQTPHSAAQVTAMVRKQIMEHPERYGKELKAVFQRSSDPVIKQAMTNISRKCGRIEDHPEYHKYARQMQNYCKMQSKRLNCYNCKL